MQLIFLRVRRRQLLRASAPKTFALASQRGKNWWKICDLCTYSTFPRHSENLKTLRVEGMLLLQGDGGREGSRKNLEVDNLGTEILEGGEGHRRWTPPQLRPHP